MPRQPRPISPVRGVPALPAPALLSLALRYNAADYEHYLGFAASFAQLVGMSTVRIGVQTDQALLNLIRKDVRNPAKIQRDRIKERAEAIVSAFPGSTVEIQDLGAIDDADSIVVTNDPENSDRLVLYPRNEKIFMGRGKGPIMVPFGDGKTSIWPAQLAVQIAKVLDVAVVFCHATYPKPELDPDVSVIEHLSRNAAETLGELETIALAAHVPSVRALALGLEGVTEHLFMSALRYRCSLIVAAEGRVVDRDHYSDVLVSSSPTPVLIRRKENRNA